MKTMMTILFFIGLNSFASNAYSCRYAMNETQVKNRLVAASATHLNQTLDQLEVVSIDDFCWYESKPTSMCPAEISSLARIALMSKSDPTAVIELIYVKEMLDFNSGGTTYEFTGAAILPSPCATAAATK